MPNYTRVDRFRRIAEANRALGIADPLAPGTWVQPGAGQPSDFHRQQVMAGRHTGPAVNYRVLWRKIAQDMVVLLPQYFW